MTLTQVCDIKNNQLIITLPPGFKDVKKVTVVINDLVDTRKDKLNLLKQAAKDPLFLADMNEIATDFDALDNETL